MTAPYYQEHGAPLQLVPVTAPEAFDFGDGGAA